MITARIDISKDCDYVCVTVSSFLLPVSAHSLEGDFCVLGFKTAATPGNTATPPTGGLTAFLVGARLGEAG